MKITNPAELRAILLQTMEYVLTGKVSVGQANAVVGLSSEAHRSISQQWDMTLQIVSNPTLREGFVAEGLLLVSMPKKGETL